MPVTRPIRRRTKDDVPYVDGMTVYEVAAFTGGLMFDHPTWQIYEHRETWLTAAKSLYCERDRKAVRLGQIEDYFAERRAAIESILAEIKSAQAALELDASEWRKQLKAKTAKTAAEQ